QRPSSMHWSFQPVRRPSVPQVNGRGWVRNPIDAFILRKLEAQGVAPSPDSKTLRRRLHLDLVGLPPPQGQSDQVYEAQVEQLFASPQYGEKWSRHWLDLARYA